GLKLLIDGRKSANVMVMDNLDGQGDDWNVFARPFTNIIPDPKSTALKAAVWLFQFFVDDALKLGLHHFSYYNSNGTNSLKDIYPRQIVFVPRDEVKYSGLTINDYRNELAKLQSGQPLYDVYGISKNGVKYKIGILYLRSSFVSSVFGDVLLHFAHTEYIEPYWSPAGETSRRE
ncbi:MAG: hypothetical protein KDD40_09715, partial [Bdellovibrionales bacterium]|nr:hypothetical protein [Bdellovibrionales bacterium]